MNESQDICTRAVGTVCAQHGTSHWCPAVELNDATRCRCGMCFTQEAPPIAKQLRALADKLFDPILTDPARPSQVAFMKEAAKQMREAWEGEDCDPAEAEFYLAVADYLHSEDTHQYGPTEHAIYIARAYLGRHE